MSTFYVTFGQRYRTEPHPVLGELPSLPDGWIAVEALEIGQARAAVAALLGREWSDVYADEPSAKWFPLGRLGVITEDRVLVVEGAPVDDKWREVVFAEMLGATPMTEWTAERLDALPEGTVIETAYGGKQLLFARVADGMTSGMWVDLEEWGDCVSSRHIWVDADDGSIRVVSVPVDALLTDEALNAWRSLPIRLDDHYTRTIMRGAIAHITGEEL